MNSRSSPWPTARCQMGYSTSVLPVHSFILPTKPLEYVSFGLLCNLAGTELVHVAEEKQAQRLDREVLYRRTLLTMDTQQRDEMSWAIVELYRLSADWVYLMRMRRSESQVPFSASCLSARPSCFLAADTGFSWLRAHAHSELQQLWDYSGFIDLSKEPQTCWAGVKPGPQHPGNYQSGSNNHSANGFHTLLECWMIMLPNIL